jgi:hypothetical protein
MVVMSLEAVLFVAFVPNVEKSTFAQLYIPIPTMTSNDFICLNFAQGFYLSFHKSALTNYSTI